MGPEEELRARSEALEEAVLTSAAAGLDELHVEFFVSSSGGAGMRSGVGYAGATRPRVLSPCASPLSRALGRSRLGRASTSPSGPPGWQHVWLRWQLWGLGSSICRRCGPVQLWLRQKKGGFTR